MTKKPRNPADYVIGDDVEVSDVDLKQEEVYVDGERLTDERVEQMASESLRLARERSQPDSWRQVSVRRLCALAGCAGGRFEGYPRQAQGAGAQPEDERI